MALYTGIFTKIVNLQYGMDLSFNTARFLTSACGACCSFQHLRGHKIDLGVVGSLNTAFDP